MVLVFLYLHPISIEKCKRHKPLTLTSDSRVRRVTHDPNQNQKTKGKNNCQPDKTSVNFLPILIFHIGCRRHFLIFLVDSAVVLSLDARFPCQREKNVGWGWMGLAIGILLTTFSFCLLFFSTTSLFSSASLHSLAFFSSGWPKWPIESP